MLTSEKIALAAHLHVVLRRKTGRVTDTEWMASNAEYAREIIRFSRAKALEDGHEDLAMWAGKLEAAMLLVKPAKPVPAEPVLHRVEPPRPERASRWTESQRQRLEAVNEPMDSSRNSGFGHSIFGETGFLESTFGPPDPRRDPDAPRYVGGIR